jgi:hypothetical protein
MSHNAGDGKFVLRAYTPKEMRNLYGVSPHIFKKWIEDFKEEIGELKANSYTIFQVKIIIDKLGVPGIIES